MEYSRDIFTRISPPRLVEVKMNRYERNSQELTIRIFDDYKTSIKEKNVDVIFTRKCIFEPDKFFVISTTFVVTLDLNMELENITQEEINGKIKNDIGYILDNALAKSSMIVSNLSNEIFGMPLVTQPVYSPEEQ